MADENLIEIGMSLNLPPAETEKLDKIFEKIESISNGMKRLGINPSQTGLDKVSMQVDNINAKMQQLHSNVQKIDLSKSILGFGDVTKYTQGISKMGNEWVKVSQIIKAGGNDVIKITGDINKSTGEFIQRSRDMTSGLQDTKNATVGWSESIQTAWKRSVQWLVAMTALYGTLHMLRDAFKTMVDVETEATNIFKVLPQSNAQKQMNQLLPAATSLAKQYGESITEVESSMAVWARQTKNTNDIITLTRASILAATATDISYADSVKYISAITSEWKMSANQAVHVVDVLNEHSNNYRVTAEGLAQALAKTGSGAKAAGMTFEELSGILTTSIQSLGLEGGEAGTFISRLMSRMIGNNKAKQAIEKLGISTMQPLSKIMDQLMIKWDGLSNAEKRNFAVIVAGSHHWNKMVGLLDNGATIIQATADAYLSAGSAQDEVTTMMATTQKQIAQLNATWQEFITRNKSVLDITKALVNALESVVNGMNKSNTAILAIVGTLTLVAAIIGACTGNWFLLIGVVAAAGTAFGLFGANATTATQRINELKVAQEQLAQKIEGDFSRAQGVKYLTEQYNTLRSAIAKAKVSGEDYHGLQVKLNVVTEKLIQGIAGENVQLANKLRKYSDLNDASKKALQDIVDEVNADRRMEALKRAEIANTQSAKLTAHLTTLAMLDDEYRAFMHYENLKQKAATNPIEAFKFGWEKGGGWKSATTALVSGALSSISKGKLAFENPLMKVFGLDKNNWSRFDNNPYIKEMLGRRTDLHITWDDIKKSTPNFSLAEVLGYNTNSGAEGEDNLFGDDGKKKSINTQMSKFTEAQAKWIRDTAIAADKAANIPADKIQETIYSYIDATGKIVGSLPTFRASSEAVSQAEQRVTDFNSSINELVSGFKSAIDASDSLVKSFKQLKADPAKEWQTSLDKAFDSLVKPKTDTEQQVGDLFTKVSSIYQESFDKVNNDIVNRQDLIQKSWEQIGQNNKYLITAEDVKSKLNDGIPIDPKIKSELAAALGVFHIDVKDITANTVDDLIKLITDKNKELQRLNSEQVGTLMSSGDFYSKLKSQMDKMPGLQQIFDTVGTVIGESYNGVLSSKNTLSTAQPKQGSYAEYGLKSDIYNAELEYQDTIDWTIQLLKNAEQRTPEMAKGIDVLITWLTNILQQSKNELKAPTNPWQTIEDKYKFTKSSDYDDLAQSLGQGSGANLLSNLGMEFGKSIDKIKDKIREQIVVLNELVPGTDDYNTKLEEIRNELQLVSTMEITNKIGDAFKAILKGTKNWKDALMDAFSDSRAEGIDRFMDNWMKSFNESMSFNDSNGLKATLNNAFQSFADTWKAASKAQKIQLAMSAGSLFIKNNGSKQSAQEQGIVEGASAGASVGGPWGAVIGGVLGFLGGNKKYKQQKKQNNADLRTSIRDSMTTDTWQAYNEFLRAGQAGFGWTTTKHTLAGITSIFGTDKSKLHEVSTQEVIKRWKELFENGGINKLINSGNTYLLQTLEKWAKYLDSLNASVTNVASSLENAFAADSYIGFLQNWGQSLEEMTRTALIRGFMAQSSFQTLYKNLSNTIGMAVLDGTLSPDEIKSIKEQGSIISGQMRTLYQSLALVDNMYPDTNTSSSSNQSYQAGSSIPIVYNNYVNLYCQAFMGDRDDARTFALMMRDEIVAEEARG